MKKLYFVSILIVMTVYAQDMRQNASVSLFSDRKANRIGDAITIIVSESSEASNNAKTSGGRNSSLGFGAGGSMLGSKQDLDLGTSNDFSGSGATAASGMVETRISATIDSVLSNGDLCISGNRKISINGEEQLISIKGVVRTVDIDSDNTVYSYNISDAELIISGKGLINKMQKPGLFTKFINWLF
jgi:flagellar L-ring protein precursor FlgH